jgi:hypothetical protein
MINFCFNFFRVLGVAGLLVGASNIQAQGLVMQPLEKNTTLQKMKQERNGARSRTACPSIILSLPFFEDFSSTEGIYPSCEKWEENLVFINNTMADNPPSIGVATFDGLDANGEPYNQGASVTAGTPADTLTSQLFDLSTASRNSELKLSYYLQAQGLGDRPSIQDSIVVVYL